MDANFTQTKILAGATLPGSAIAICMDCGAVRLNRLEGKMKLMPKQGHPIVPPTVQSSHKESRRMMNYRAFKEDDIMK